MRRGDYTILMRAVLIMDMEGISTLITTLGFPIFCVIYLFYSQTKEREEHSKEVKALSEALNNNTLALTQLTDYIKRNEKS